MNQKSQPGSQNEQSNSRADGGGGNILRQRYAEIVQQDGGHADAGGKALVLAQGRNKEAESNERRAHQEERDQRTVGGGQVHFAELGKDDGINGNDAQGDHKDQQKRRIFAHDDLEGGDGQGVKQLIGFLAAFLGNDAHGQDGNDHRIDNAAETQYILKIAHGSLQVVQHCADAHNDQQKCAEHVGSQRLEVHPQFMLEYSDHDYASFCPAGFSLVLDSVSSIKTSSSVPFFRAISRITLSLAVNAR